MKRKSLFTVSRAILAASVAASLALVPLLSGCSPKKGTEQYLDASHPVQVTLWTYYNGKQLEAFENLVNEYNATRGVEVGVTVTSESRGGVDDLAAAVMDSAEGKVGASQMPDAFLSYSDTAFELNKEGKLADLNDYLADDAKSRFVEGFLAEGDIAGDGTLKLYPVSKSTETLQVNKTDWDKFAKATGASLDDLSTIEGVTETARRYYEWTDAQTPKKKDDGKAFFGRDSIANYLLAASGQLGHPLVKAEGGKGTVTLDKDTVRALWDNYYVPMVNGWFSHDGRFRSDAVKTGELLAYVGSSSSVAYLPTSVAEEDGKTYSIQMETLKNPIFKGGKSSTVQQGAGFAVTEGEDRAEAACVDFLNWFTDTERNTEFAVNAGYLPVTKDALTQENIEKVAGEIGDSAAAYVSALPATLDTVNSGLYVNVCFENSNAFRTVLENSLEKKAEEDQAAVDKAVAKGTARAEAAGKLTTDENFEAWYQQLESELSASLEG